jgi:hypothetical protein
MTTVCGFSELKPIVWQSINTARACRGGGASAAMEVVAKVVPERFAAAIPSLVEAAPSATSTQGPQCEDEIGAAIVEVV